MNRIVPGAQYVLSKCLLRPRDATEWLGCLSVIHDAPRSTPNARWGQGWREKETQRGERNVIDTVKQ